MTIMHCFGTDKTPHVDSDLAVKMIEASGIKEITLNTHKIDHVTDWRELPIGYGDASWNSLSKHLNVSDYNPIFNINLPESADEAIFRTEKAIKLNSTFPIKLEVLNKDHSQPNNTEVIKAAKYLKHSYNTLKVWPLIKPDATDYYSLKKIGCEMIRIIGSPIGSSEGISFQTQELIKYILKDNARPLIVIDGGIGNISDIKLAMKLKVDRVLVNSFLFKNNNAVSMLSEIKSILN